ncbi:hypothetical protein, partial [Pseudoalteromonas piscicida]|uniref:hypothetical protein n=1 Tax=Pseudoalteromonas piscicida TaxID=43662 RepID=UPI001A8D20AF
QIKSLVSLAGTQTRRLCHFVRIIAAMFVPLMWALYGIRQGEHIETSAITVNFIKPQRWSNSRGLRYR